MTDTRHPVARHEQAHRILPHTLVEICSLLGADTFSFDEPEVTFRRRAVAAAPAAVWWARVGDWAVFDRDLGWRLVADVVVPAEPLDRAGLAPTRPLSQPFRGR